MTTHQPPDRNQQGDIPGFDDLDIEALRRRRGKKWNTFGPDVLPAWVADMDFPVAPPIKARLTARVKF